MTSTGFDRMGRPRASRSRQLARRLLLGCLPRSRFCSTGGAHFPVRWTFDDGPDPEHTPRILEVLRKHDQRAAFFMIGSKAAAFPELVRRVVAEGHLVGSHSYNHPAAGALGTDDYLADIGRARTELEAITGQSVPLFRPPHGHLSVGVLARMMVKDWKIVLWSVDPKDYAIDCPSELTDRLFASKIAHPDIVLLHDTSSATAVGLEHYLATNTRENDG